MQYRGKRLLDFTLSLGLIILLAPILYAVARRVRKSSPGPVLFRQRRIGKGGREFVILKFRTLYQGTERYDDLVHHHDPRQTQLGKKLRRTHLDELPQLFNVLRGDMSLVGPRPLTPEKYARRAAKDPRWQQVYAQKPGLVGPVCLRGKIEVLETADPAFDGAALELAYQARQNLAADLYLLWQAFRLLLRELFKSEYEQCAPGVQLELSPIRLRQR